MKKILTLLASLGLTTIASTNVVSCRGEKPSQLVNKIDLKDLTLLPCASSATTQEEAFTSFCTLNQANFPDLKDKVQADGFTPSNWGIPGKLTIKAKEGDLKYKGTVDIIIPALQTIALSSLNQTALTGVEQMNQTSAWQAFLNNNPNNKDLEQYVSVRFAAPDYNNPGKLVITATSNGKYTGNITIMINAVAKKDLNSLGLNLSLSDWSLNQDTAWQAFLTANSNIPNLSDSVEVVSFTAATFTAQGSLQIKAKLNTMYCGGVSVKLAAKPRDLGALNLNTTVAVSLTATQEEVFQTFLDENKAILEGGGLTLDQVNLSEFKAPDYNQNGKLLITSVSTNSNWKGKIGLRIKYILTGDNFEEIFRYFSDHDLLQFKIIAGNITKTGDLAIIARDELNNEMKQFYEYEPNIDWIRLDAWAWRDWDEGHQNEIEPSLEKLNTPGNVYHLSGFYAKIAIDYFNDSIKYIEGQWSVTWTTIGK